MQNDKHIVIGTNAEQRGPVSVALFSSPGLVPAGNMLVVGGGADERLKIAWTIAMHESDRGVLCHFIDADGHLGGPGNRDLSRPVTAEDGPEEDEAPLTMVSSGETGRARKRDALQEYQRSLWERAVRERKQVGRSQPRLIVLSEYLDTTEGDLPLEDTKTRLASGRTYGIVTVATAEMLSKHNRLDDQMVRSARFIALFPAEESGDTPDGLKLGKREREFLKRSGPAGFALRAHMETTVLAKLVEDC